MKPLPKESTPQDRTDLAIAIAQHPHLTACDFCAQALAEITADVCEPWSRQTLNALAHRCQQSDELQRFRDEPPAPLPGVTPTPDDPEPPTE